MSSSKLNPSCNIIPVSQTDPSLNGFYFHQIDELSELSDTYSDSDSDDEFDMFGYPLCHSEEEPDQEEEDFDIDGFLTDVGQYDQYFTSEYLRQADEAAEEEELYGWLKVLFVETE